MTTIANSNAATKAEIQALNTSILDSVGTPLISASWPSVVTVTNGAIASIAFTGPTGTWTMVPTYTNYQLTSILITDPAANTYKQTVTNTTNPATTLSAWVKQ